MRVAVDRPAFCRVTLLTPRRRVDVALPADVPLAELVPMVLELLGEPLVPVRWRFAAVTGGPLPPGATLDALGVADGELLRLGPAVAPPAPPVFDDPVEAVAAGAGSGDPAGAWLRAAVVVAASVLAGGLLCVAARGAAGTAVVVAVLLAVAGTVMCLVRAAGSAREADAAVRRAAEATRGRHEGGAPVPRSPHPAADPGAGPGPFPVGNAPGGAAGFAATVAAVCAVPLVAAAGWAAVPGPAGSGQLLVAAAAAGTVAAVGQVLVRVVAPVLVGVVVAAAVLSVLALLRLWFGLDPAALAAGAAAVTLAGAPLLPRTALRLAGLPQPSVAADAAELATDDRLDRLSPAELADRTDLARGLLAGLTAGTAATAATAAVLVAAAGGWLGPVTAAVVVAVLGLRMRGFADPEPARASLVAALTGAAGIAAVLAAGGGTPVRLALAAGCTVLAVGAVAAVGLTGRGGPVGSPVSRRGVDLLENTLLAASVPLALGVMDVYALVRGL